MSGLGGGLYGGTGPLGSSVTEAELSLSDITTANATAARHGLLPKLSNSASDVLKGDGTWGAAAGGGTALTAGDLTVTNDGSNGKPFVAIWTQEQVTDLGAVTSGTLVAATLPAKTVVTNVFLRRGSRETSLAALTVSCGRTGASYVDYIAAQDATLALSDATTLYGNAAAERGTNNTGYDLISWSSTTPVLIRFDGGAENLSSGDGIGGTIIIEYFVIP